MPVQRKQNMLPVQLVHPNNIHFVKILPINAGVEKKRYNSRADECLNILDSVPVGMGKEEGMWVFLGYTYSMFGRDGYTGGTLYHMDKDAKSVLKKYKLQTADNIVSTIFSLKDYHDYKSYNIDIH